MDRARGRCGGGPLFSAQRRDRPFIACGNRDCSLSLTLNSLSLLSLILFASLDHAPELHSQDLPLYPLFAYRPSVLLIPRRFPKTIRRGLSDIKVSTSLLV